MKYTITKLQIDVLTWIAKKIVRQSYEHRSNIVIYYKIINDAARAEFEDSVPNTICTFLEECYEDSFK